MKASLLYNNNRVQFRLIPGEYQNIIVFLETNNILFVSEMQLDFSKIPLQLHGRGNSNNLLEYLSNNNTDYNLLFSFLNYFISNVINIQYENGHNIIFSFLENVKWQNMMMFIPSSTTTTTTTIDPNNYIVTLSGNKIKTLSGNYIVL
jgi:hypothetical protein